MFLIGPCENVVALREPSGHYGSLTIKYSTMLAEFGLYCNAVTAISLGMLTYSGRLYKEYLTNVFYLQIEFKIGFKKRLAKQPGHTICLSSLLSSVSSSSVSSSISSSVSSSSSSSSS
ncbi:hypothetical protein M0802_002472 [Mischocyttarus mexicanus]|nr:hypothetical protein M0802_002472 [Mischocyttarus mexicanus]